MTDIKSAEERSRNMAAIKSGNTKPEILVRKFLFAKGLRFRIKSKLPGHPDIVLPKYKTVVFVDGCFWHGHANCKYFRLPASNTEFWKAKIEGNAARDLRQTEELRKLGWRVIRIWECSLRRNPQRDETLESLWRNITGITEPELSVAAEPIADYGKA